MRLSEKILVRELRKGNSKAYEELYAHFHKKLYNYCYKITKNELESQGLVQEVFISVWENRKNLDEERSFSGFLFKIARNKCLNVLKHKVSQRVYYHYVKNGQYDPNDLWNKIEFEELNKIISDTIESLPERRKEIFKLSRHHGLTYKEIGSRLEISENIVDHEIRKALGEIKDSLAKFRSS